MVKIKNTNVIDKTAVLGCVLKVRCYDTEGLNLGLVGIVFSGKKIIFLFCLTSYEKRLAKFSHQKMYIFSAWV